MTRELVVKESGTLSPHDVVAVATVQAKLLMDIVERTKCYQIINDKKYLQVEAWETIGAFNRVHAVTESITPILSDGILVGYDAKVNLINTEGLIVGSAIMPCYFTENACKGKEGDAKDKAAKSAAQTFATSKAYRMNYSYVAILAGYQPTPAEEMPEDGTLRPSKEHWCEEHQTEYRKYSKGKNTWYAHPIKGTDKWCNETKVDKTASTESTEDKPPEVPEAPKTKEADVPNPYAYVFTDQSNLGDFFNAALKCFKIDKTQVLKELNMTSQMEISDKQGSWETLCGIYVRKE